MPTYTFKNENTGELEEHIIKMSEYDEFVKNNPHLKRSYSSDVPNIVGGVYVGNSSKPDEGFRDVLRQVKKNHRGSKINTF
jgi:hypothetical protein